MKPRPFGLSLSLGTLALMAFTSQSAAQAFNGSTTYGANYLEPVVPHVFDGDLRQLPRSRAWSPGDPIKEIPKRRKPPEIAVEGNPRLHGFDPLAEDEREARAATMSRAFSTLSFNQDGLGYTGVNPPDTVGDVGPTYYIQTINGSSGTRVRIIEKATGSLATPEFDLDSLGSGNCASGLGDPIVLYDQLAGRWLLTEFSSSGNQLCVYVSQSSDPVSGGWYNYAFTGANGFPDYPKYSVWHDAYYITSNESAPTLYALQRNQMLAGLGAGMQSMNAPSLSGFGFQALTPADHDGPTPPFAGSPGIFARHRDTESHGAGTCVDAATSDCLEIFEFDVDWATPANSSLTLVQTIPVAEFDSDLCGLFSFNCFPQPGSTTTLDPLREVIMWRLQYRNFSSYETLVGSYVTDVDGSDRGGVRWFELRRAGGSWFLEQEGTYSPDSVNRWMSSIAMDGSGNIAMLYNVSDGNTTYPGLRYTGRLSTDPAGVMGQGEGTLIAGAAANASNRYGDYSAMSVDPADDCTFWFTGEHNALSSWSTRIGALQFTECTGSIGPDFALSSPTPMPVNVCAGDPIEVQVDVASVGGFSDPVWLSHVGLPGGLYPVSLSPNPVVPPGYSDVQTGTLPGTMGSFSYLIEGSVPDVGFKTLDVDVNVFASNPPAPGLLNPFDGTVGVPTQPAFAWDGDPASATYTIEISTGSDFSAGNLVQSAVVAVPGFTPATPLDADTQYYWRVTSHNPCGSSAVSPTSVFRTMPQYVFCSSPGLAIPDDDPMGATDNLVVSGAGTITDIDVTVQMTHTYTGDLDIYLVSPDDTLVQLFEQSCVSSDNLDVIFDDESANGPVTCPPTDGLDHTPYQPLAAFDGDALDGTWQLTVIDNYGFDVGTLDYWCLHAEISGSAGSGPIDCDGTDVVLQDQIVPSGEHVICNANGFTGKDLVVSGELTVIGSPAAFNSLFKVKAGGSLTVQP